MKLTLEKAAQDDALLEIGRRAVEDELIEMRDMRLALLGRNNGLVVKECDGSDSSIIRLSTEQALRIGLEAMAKSLDA